MGAGAGQRTVLDLKLGSMADGVTGQTVIDAAGYLTELCGQEIPSMNELSDMQKVRAELWTAVPEVTVLTEVCYSMLQVITRL